MIFSSFNIVSLINIPIIFLIFIQMPKESTGLTSFVNQNQFTGSPTALQKIIKILTLMIILIYVLLAFQLSINA